MVSSNSEPEDKLPLAPEPFEPLGNADAHIPESNRLSESLRLCASPVRVGVGISRGVTGGTLPGG